MNQETLCTMALTQVKRLSLKHALELYRKAGNAQDIWKGIEQGSNLFPGNAIIYNILKNGKEEAFHKARKEVTFCEQKNIKCICLNDEAYPHRLRPCEDAPLVLYYMGTADLNAPHMVSMVGTRHPTEYGKDLCSQITSSLSKALPNTVIVSGLAYGIDIHSHRGALTSGLPTIAVLAHGLDRIYPLTHRDTAKTIITQGALLTEYMTGTNPDKQNFIRRNRIVAGITDATIIVESAKRGGAMKTAQLAFDYNRQVFACPGRIGDEYSEGSNTLIRKNIAALFSQTEDFLDEMGWVSVEELAKIREKGIQPDLFPQLSDDENKVLGCLYHSEEGMLIDQIAREIDIKTHMISTILFDLEMAGLVRLMPGGRYRVVKIN